MKKKTSVVVVVIFVPSFTFSTTSFHFSSIFFLSRSRRTRLLSFFSSENVSFFFDRRRSLPPGVRTAGIHSYVSNSPSVSSRSLSPRPSSFRRPFHRIHEFFPDKGSFRKRAQNRRPCRRIIIIFLAAVSPPPMMMMMIHHSLVAALLRRLLRPAREEEKRVSHPSLDLFALPLCLSLRAQDCSFVREHESMMMMMMMMRFGSLAETRFIDAGRLGLLGPGRPAATRARMIALVVVALTSRTRDETQVESLFGRLFL